MIRWMEERKIFLRYVLLAAYLFYGDSDRAPGQERISYTVTRLSGANGWKAYVVEDGVRRDLHYEGGYFRGLAYEGQTYYMERTFGEDDLFRAEDGTAKPVSLHVRALWGHLSVFLDGALAFTDSPDQPAVIGQIDFDRTQPENLAGARAHYYGSQTSLRLTDYAGVTVTIAQNEIGTGMGERLYTCDAYVSTTAADTDRYIFTTFMHLIPPLLLLMVGVTLVVLFLYQAYHEQTQRVRLFICWRCSRCSGRRTCTWRCRFTRMSFPGASACTAGRRGIFTSCRCWSTCACRCGAAACRWPSC